MIEVRVGTTDALEVREDVDGNQSTVKAPGERIVSFLMPDGVSAMDASSQVIGALSGVMVEVGSTPWWIESNDQAVAANLLSHYTPAFDQMPAAWGDGSTTNPGGPSQTLYQAASPPPDPQLPSAPVVAPEDEAFLVQQEGAMPATVQTMSVEPEPEVVEQSATTRTTRTRKKAAAEPAPEPEPAPVAEPVAEPQPEESP